MFGEKTAAKRADKVIVLSQNVKNYFKEKYGIKPKESMWALRAAITGRIHGADLGVIIELLGKDRVEKRVQACIF